MSQQSSLSLKPSTYSPHSSSHRARCATKRFAATLLRRLPTSLEEASQRVAPLGLTLIRRSLVTMIERSELTAWESDRLSPLFKVIGVGDQGERLTSLLSPQRGEARRAQALAALFHSDEGQRAFSHLTDAERVELCAPWVRPMMALVREDRFPRFALAALFDSTPTEHRGALLERFERCRREVGGCPQRAYEVLLQQLELSLWELNKLFELLAQVGQLEELREVISESAPLVQSAFRGALRKVSDAQAG